MKERKNGHTYLKRLFLAFYIPFAVNIPVAAYVWNMGIWPGFQTVSPPGPAARNLLLVMTLAVTWVIWMVFQIMPCLLYTSATQMLDSMIRNPRPTRAEVTDVANAVYDGTDAVMLSGETAMGKYPVEALKMMVSIAEESESYLDYAAYRQRKVSKQNMKNVSNAVCFASVSTAHDLSADVIIAPSITGFTTQMLSKWRPGARIIGMSPSMATVRQMQLQWGVVPIWSRRAESTDELIENSAQELKERGLVTEGELAVITAGVVTYARRHEAATQTNIMRVINIE